MEYASLPVKPVVHGATRTQNDKPVSSAPRGVATVSKRCFRPNGFGLYNMSGNVWGGLLDFYSDYSRLHRFEIEGPAAGTKRSVGCWADDEQSLWSTQRANRIPSERSDEIGFRVVVIPASQPEYLDFYAGQFRPTQCRPRWIPNLSLGA
jgi:formylglycine-generating enzyme required for sulfatase activity